MTKALVTLIKLAEHKVEDAQKALAVTRGAMDKVDQQRQALAEEVRRGGEVAVASGDATLLMQAAAFVQRAKVKDAALLDEREALQRRLAEEQNYLAAEFATQKRYETLHQREQQRAKRRREAKLQGQLDEIAGMADWRTNGGTD